MKIESKTFKFILLTPCFSGTALGKHGGAEMRVPPIRGHIRYWHRVLYGAQDCNIVWGSAGRDKQEASKVAIRLSEPINSNNQDFPILPHKNRGGGHAMAIPPETQFEFELQRLVGCSNDQWERAIKATKLWLLLGSLGLRSNRAAGSVWPLENWTPDQKDFIQTLGDLGLRKYNIALIGLTINRTFSPEDLRKAASDTISGRAPEEIFGKMNPRTPSPVKFKVIKLNQKHCLLASAPNRGNENILKEAENLLKTKPRWQDLGDWDHNPF